MWTVWTVCVCVCVLCLVPTVAPEAQLCTPGVSDGYKVRISIKTALGEEAYAWNEAEMFFFRAALAFAMQQHTKNWNYSVSNILVCDPTVRVSFWFVVTTPGNISDLVPKSEVEKAIRNSRKRINSAFLLTDQTLDFVGINPTLAAPDVYNPEPWLIAFGVVMGLVCAGILALLTSTLLQKRRGKKASAEAADEQEVGEISAGNGVLCETLRDKDGNCNRGFIHDERFTKL